MSSPQQRAIVGGLKAQRKFSAQAIVYHRGSDDIDITAIKGKRLQQLMDAAGFIQSTGELSDWLFELSDMADLTPAYPQAGDWVEWQSKKYAVVAAEDGRLYRYVDPEETWIRVHTTHAGDASNTTTTAAPTTTTTGA